MYQQKTLETKASVEEYLDRIEDARKREEAREIVAMCQDATKETPTLWGESIIGFGSYAYQYASGHKGVAAKVGYSPRKTHHVLYLVLWESEIADLLGRLGKVKHGVSCLYVKRLEDIDRAILQTMITRSYAIMSAQDREGTFKAPLE
jgi:hypothetical protein